MGYSFKFIFRNDSIRKDKTVHILLRVIIDREVARHKTGIFVEPAKWDDSKQRIKGTIPLVYAQNKLLETIYVKAIETINTLYRKNLPISHGTFKEIFKLNNVKRLDFFELWQEYIDHIDGIQAPGSVTNMIYERKKMMRFKKQLDIHELNMDFITRYEKYLRSKLVNGSNTIQKSIKRIHVVLNYLVRNKTIEENPIKGFHVKGEASKRIYITHEELSAFEDLKNKPILKDQALQNVYNCFLFSCYTGLRYRDIKDLKHENIIHSRDGSHIDIIMQKTKEQVVVPLTPKALDLIKKDRPKNELVFKTYGTQKINSLLRELIAEAKISKHISFHCARHTFATVAVNNSIPIEVVQKLLGHNSIKTTQIYSKIMNKTLFNEMEKMK